MKRIKKRDLEILVQETKAYYVDGDVSRLKRRTIISRKISKDIDVDWGCIEDLIKAIYAGGGFAEDLPEETLYAILGLLGVEVV